MHVKDQTTGSYDSVDILKSGGVDDVQINGTSVVENNIAEIDLTSYAKSVDIPTTASDVNAIASPLSASAGDFLVYNGTTWVAQTLATWQGGNY